MIISKCNLSLAIVNIDCRQYIENLPLSDSRYYFKSILNVQITIKCNVITIYTLESTNIE